MRTICAALAVAVAGLVAGTAVAHERDFTLSRDWHLPYVGECEVESRSFWNERSHDFTQQFEFEYGITKHFAIEPGLTFHKDVGDELDLDALDTELRFNFLDFDYGKILPAFNIEYEHPVGNDEKDRAEAKFILSMYGTHGEDLTVNYNIGQELVHRGDSESELTAGYVFSLSSLLGIDDDEKPKSESPEGGTEPPRKFGRSDTLKAGVEFIQDFEETHTGLGPIVSFRVSRNLHVLATYVVGLNDRPDNEDQARVILEWEF